MRKLQEIFDVVIAEQFYGNDHTLSTQTGFMCNALTRAAYADVITWPERDKAQAAIDKYMTHLRGGPCTGNYITLAGVMAYGLGGDCAGVSPFSRTMKVYKNWKRRPKRKFQ